MTKRCLSAKELGTCGEQSGFKRGERGELILADRQCPGTFVSRIYDSGTPGTEWNRLLLQISHPAVLQVYVYLFDDLQEGRQTGKKETLNERFAYLQKNAQYTSNYREMLLYGQEYGKGRFAQIGLKLFTKNVRGDRAAAQFYGYEMSFPKESFTRYLPAIYRGNLALERFLAVHQSLYLDLERQIDNLAVSLDFEVNGKEELSLLAGWMGWGELALIGEEETLRKLLGTGMSLIRKKGSLEYYTEMVRLLLDLEPVVVEETKKRKCTLLLLEPPPEEKEKYLQWLRADMPVGIKMELLVLNRTTYLDGQYFLDTTSRLSEEESALLEGGILLGAVRLL